MFEQIVPDLLARFIDRDRWPRRFELVELVASHMLFGRAAPIGRRLLVELGRSEEQARHDHKHLLGLAADGILIRFTSPGGQYPDYWAISPDVGHWRNVPWRPHGQRRAAAWAKESAGTPARQGGTPPTNPLVTGGGGARQGGTLSQFVPPLEPADEGSTSAPGVPPSRAGVPPWRAAPPPVTSTAAEGVPPWRAADRAPDTMPLGFTHYVRKTSLSLSNPNGADDRGREGEDASASEPQPAIDFELVGRLSTVLGCPVYGQPARELTALAAEYGRDTVLAHLPSLHGTVRADMGLQALRARLTAGAARSPTWAPACVRCNDSGLIMRPDGSLDLDQPCDHGGL